MSDCIISIKIGDQVITLDPNSDISAENKELLARVIPVDKLRALYSNLKDQGDFDTTLTGGNPDLASEGEQLYDSMINNAKRENPPRYLTPYAALQEANTPEQRTLLSGYISSLNPNAVHPTGNYLDNMKNSYMLSPYTQSDIRGLVFNTGRSKTRALELYDQLLSIPGMETTRISIAYASNLHNDPTRPISTIHGAYISPDNIIQILLPLTPEYREESDNIDGVSKANIPKKVLNELQGKLLHELSHAVYTELLRSDPEFYKQIKMLHSRFIDAMQHSDDPKQNTFATTYKDINEFVADMIGSIPLQTQLSNVLGERVGEKKNSYLHETLGDNKLYQFLIGSLPSKLQGNASMLKDVLSLAGSRVPRGELADSLQKRQEDFAAMKSNQSIFFTKAMHSTISDGELTHQEIADRRIQLLNYHTEDMQAVDFTFKDALAATVFNNKQKITGRNERYIPLTSSVIDSKAGRSDVFLDRDLQPIPEERAVYVRALFDDDTFNSVDRALSSNSRKYSVSDIVDGSKYVPEIVNRLLPGDYITTTSRSANGKVEKTTDIIDRVEGGNIYKVNQDLSASIVPIANIESVKTSIRNYMIDPTRDADFKQVIDDRIGSKKIQSLDLSFKSPADSRRALLEIGNRLQQLNPDITLHYADTSTIDAIRKATTHDYSQARAFVLGGEVYINMNKASISDVIHEYAHLFLHSLKYEGTDLYNAIIQSTSKHPLYDTIANNYQHLDNRSDLNEEVFVTLLGEYMKGSMSELNKQHMDVSKSVIEGFAEYTTQKLSTLLGAQKDDLYSMAPEDILNMRMEDVISMVGDHIMQNKLSGIYDAFDSSHDVEELKRTLKDKGIITQECYG